MKNWIKERLDERGSMTIEFLGMIPLVFIVIMIAWQFIAGAHAVILAESAANEAAKVYSVTAEASEASAAAEQIVSAGGQHVGFAGAPISGTDQFSAAVSVDIALVFLPAKLFPNGKPTFTYTADTSGKVIK
ncbi:MULTISPECIES: TadE family protein [Jeotgalibacillus]|uniref:TadE family protein n=1 Tax=Jeotgalibacillus TaxID=157226 RepID=UPI001069D764|nr:MULTISPECIES: TadE family protein [Jeotgalibacillus]TFD99387.1 pilus assembly protein [Jeotgalibacillus sp. R-1-5s-1]